MRIRNRAGAARAARVRLRFGALLLASVAGVLATKQVGAATATANLSVTASVAANCSISTNALTFGSYDPIVTHASSPLDGTGSIVVTCTTGASTAVTLGQGSFANTGSTDAAPLRRMRSGTTNFLSYSLFQDGGRTTLWGNTPATSVAHTGTGSSTSITVHGRVTAGQNVPSGTYTDTVVATITF